MKHLKLFNDTASYEAWKNGEDYVNPAVSYVEENANIDTQGNIVVDVHDVPGLDGTKAMYWTSKSVNDIPMHFEYTVYDSSSNVALSGEFNERITILSNDRPSQFINLQKNNMDYSWAILEIKSKISNKTHRIKFE